MSIEVIDGIETPLQAAALLMDQLDDLESVVIIKKWKDIEEPTTVSHSTVRHDDLVYAAFVLYSYATEKSTS